VGTGKPGKSDSPAAFDEPAGISYAAGKLYVADTNNHLIRTVDLKSHEVKTLNIDGLAPPALTVAGSPPPAVDAASKRPAFRNAEQVKLDPVALRPKDGAIALKVDLQLPYGWHMNPLAPSVYVVDAASAQGPVQRAALGEVSKVKESAESFEIPVKLAASTGEDQVTVSLNYFYCQGGPQGVCKTGSVVWSVPIKLTPDAKSSVATLAHKVVAR
jgi:hypothetical protein